MAALPNSVTNEEFEKYYLIRLLGEGGSGVVFLAERKDIHSIVAISIVRPRRQRGSPHEHRHLLNWIIRASHTSWTRVRCAHPCSRPPRNMSKAFPISDYGRQQQSSIETANRLCPFSFGVRGRLIRLFACHHSIAIRKPSNILVTPYGTLSRPRFRHRVTPRRRRPGWSQQKERGPSPKTVAYALQILFNGLQINTQSDVYSRPIVFYELLTGHLPFDLSSKTMAEVEQTVMEFTAQPPSLATHPCSSLPKSMRSDLDVLRLTAMHRDPQRRYRSVEALTR